MPIYEFKCLDCGALNELLIMNTEDHMEMCCRDCRSSHLERVLSTTHYNMSGPTSGAGAHTQSRTCASGSCTTYDIPGPA